MKTALDERASSSDELQQQARVWLRLLISSDVKEVDVEGFQRWLRTSPAHEAAFAEVRRRWQVLGPVAREFLRTRPEAADYHERALTSGNYGRRAFLAAAAAAAGVAGVAVLYPSAYRWSSPREWRADFHTAIGEQRTVTLAEQVQVTLNTDTSIRRQSAGDQPIGIDLLAGEAAVDLPVGGMSFSVAAGPGHCLAEVGRFEVRNLEGKVRVTCIDGEVRVKHPAGMRQLRARQQTVYDAEAVGGVIGIQPETVSAWRAGALVFNEVALIDVIAEINRYRPGRIVLMKSAARNNAVSGRFLIASLDSALVQLQGMFGLQGRSLPGGLFILS